MQARAIFEAAVQVAKKGIKVIPEVMIPLVGFQKELSLQKEIVERVAKEVLEKAGVKNMKYLIGTMIEIPRGALTADQIAEVAQFFSFGTNDLTQTTLGMSRDDYTKFSKKYEELKIFKADPFQTIDQEGVGKLIEQAVKLGRSTNHNLEIGICGEHGGDPSSVEFCYRVGMDYVSCSPYRVPIARLAAAQAAIAGGDKTEAMRTAERRFSSDPEVFRQACTAWAPSDRRPLLRPAYPPESSSLSCLRRSPGPFDPACLS